LRTQTERFVVFPDIRPSAKQHLLVVPRDHIANTDSLEPWDLSLLEEMRTVGERCLRARSQNEGATRSEPEDMKFGYHVPPFRSVDHLHLHCFELPHTSALKAAKYCLPRVWLSHDGLSKRLRTQALIYTREQLYADVEQAGGNADPVDVCKDA
jgi:hypothetical protein